MQYFKNRKKSILKIFFRCMHQQIRPILNFRPNIGQISSETKKIPFGPSQKKISRDNSTFSHFCTILHFGELIWRKSIFSHLGRFGYKKHQKSKNFYFFKIFKSLRFSQYIHCWAYSQPVKSYANLKFGRPPFTWLWTIL